MRLFYTVGGMILAWIAGSVVFGLLYAAVTALLFGSDAIGSTEYKTAVVVSNLAVVIYVARTIWRAPKRLPATRLSRAERFRPRV